MKSNVEIVRFQAYMKQRHGDEIILSGDIAGLRQNLLLLFLCDSRHR